MNGLLAAAGASSSSDALPPLRRSLVRHLLLRIMPYLVFGYFTELMDRLNISFARLSMAGVRRYLQAQPKIFQLTP